MTPLFITKRSLTIVLIGDNEGGKSQLLRFLYAVLSGRDYKYYTYWSTHPVPTTAGESPHYVVNCSGGTTLNLVDTPDLTGSNISEETEAVKRAVHTLTTVDAFVVVADNTKKEFGPGVELVLEMLESLFSRPIKKDIYFLFTVADADDELSKHQQNNLTSWVLEENVIGPIVSLSKLVSRVDHANPGRADSQILHRIERAWRFATEDLQKLWESVDQSRVHAWDLKHLYRHAMEIESDLYTSLVRNKGQTGKKDVDQLARLVDEYCLVATSPDFMTHVELVRELVSLDEHASGMAPSIKKLGDAYRALKVLEREHKLYPQVFEIC